MVTKAPGKREARKISTKRLLREVALEAFTARGFGGATGAEIAETAGVSERTFWNYYPQKADVVALPYGLVVPLVMDALAREPRSTPLLPALLSSIRSSVHSFVESTDTADLLRKIARLVDEEPELLAADRALLAAVESDLIDPVARLWPEINPTTLRATIAASLVAARVAVSAWAASSETLDHHQALAFELLLVPSLQPTAAGGE